jgi:UPF0271 protein
MPLPIRVDLNADVGESFGSFTIGNDSSLMRHITSANIACGFHAGDPDVMRATVALAREHGVAVGAHPGFLDLQGFGRREIRASAREIEDLVAYQIGALAALAAVEGMRLQHVKPHGALFNMAARDGLVADAIARAVAAVDRSLILFGLSGSELIAAGTRAGLRTASEVFADRAYQADGSLLPRGNAGSLVHDPDVVVARATRMVCDGSVVASRGENVRLEVDTICVHGDTPGAAELAGRVRAALESAGVAVKAVGEP